MARKEAKKPSTWAEEAGKYYRKNVGKNGIESFTDVLKSSDFKKQYYAKNSMKRGGEGEAASVAAPAPANTTAVGPAPANTTAVEIQVPLNSVMGVMKTGGMKMKKGKSMKMKKKGKMTKKKSLKNNKKRRITKKYTGGKVNIDSEKVRCFGEITTDAVFHDNDDNENKLDLAKIYENIDEINYNTNLTIGDVVDDLIFGESKIISGLITEGDNKDKYQIQSINPPYSTGYRNRTDLNLINKVKLKTD